jgi:hypothetical protein
MPYTVFQPLYIYGPHTAKDCEQWFMDRVLRCGSWGSSRLAASCTCGSTCKRRRVGVNMHGGMVRLLWLPMKKK